LICAVQKECACEGANFYHILNVPSRMTHLPQDMFLGHLSELQGEQLLIDEGGGRIVLNPAISTKEYSKMIAVLSRCDVPQGVQL
jgi:hypothetical protein